MARETDYEMAINDARANIDRAHDAIDDAERAEYLRYADQRLRDAETIRDEERKNDGKQ